jgi:glycosyltransferase involved in cell wall biosynthesis
MTAKVHALLKGRRAGAVLGRAFEPPALDLPIRKDERLVLVQHGDYAEAVRRFEEGGGETYFAQRYTVDFVGSLTQYFGSVVVVTLWQDLPETVTSNGVTCAGIRLYPPGGSARHLGLIRMVERYRPSRLVVGGPIVPLLAWATIRRWPVLPLLADSFFHESLRTTFTRKILVSTLNRDHVRWVANHNVAASLDLARIGVRKDKILPFDWPALVSPDDFEPKSFPTHEPFRLVYAGTLLIDKGVGDALEALAWLRSESDRYTLTVVGAGDDDAAIYAKARELGLGDSVRFLGRIPHDDVLACMREHDAVLVPSRHRYPEGLPMTIYEALCTRTPVIVSDHPAFLKRIIHGDNGVVFRASDPRALADAIQRLSSDATLYERLSVRSGGAADGYLCPLKWHMLLERWLRDDDEDHQALAQYSLANGAYH